jgi:hypothetical protein
MIKTVHIAEFSTDDFMTFIGKGGACQEYAGRPGASYPLRGGAHAHHSQRLQGGCGQYMYWSMGALSTALGEARANCHQRPEGRCSYFQN